MRITYDPKADALHIFLKNFEHSAGSRRIGDTTVLDLDENGEVIGVEILFVQQRGIDPYQITTQFLDKLKT